MDETYHGTFHPAEDKGTLELGRREREGGRCQLGSEAAPRAEIYLLHGGNELLIRTSPLNSVF